MIEHPGARPATSTSRPTAGSRLAPAAPIPLREEGLGRCVGLALRVLTDRTSPPAATVVELEGLLRSAIGWSRLRLPGQDTPAAGQAAVAVRVACAYLAAGDLPEAELALVAAEDLLGNQRPATLPNGLRSAPRPVSRPPVRRSPAA